MINVVEKNDILFSEFCDRDVFGTRIKTYYNCYSTDYDFASFWIQRKENGNVTAAIGRIDSDVTLCCYDSDCEELAEFLCFIGFNTIQCEKSVADCLKNSLNVEAINGYIVEYSDKIAIDEFNLKKSFELKEIYDIIKSQNLVGVGDYLPWLSDVTFRINRECAEALLCECEGKNAGCAMVLFRTDKASLLGAVATLPEFRARGIARSLVSFLAEKEISKGNRVELLCKADSIVEFYKSIGFEVKNEWSLLTNEAKVFQNK